MYFSERFSVDSPPSEFNLSPTATHSSRKGSSHHVSLPLNALGIKNSSYLLSAKHKIVKKYSLSIFPLIPKIVSTKDFLLLPVAPRAS